MQIEELSRCFSRKAVETQLLSLPKDLDGVYEKMLLSNPNPHDLKQFLLWLAFSTRPLRVEELTEVVAVNFSADAMPFYDQDLQYFGSNDMLSTCSSFAVELNGTLNMNMNH